MDNKKKNLETSILKVNKEEKKEKVEKRQKDNFKDLTKCVMTKEEFKKFWKLDD